MTEFRGDEYLCKLSKEYLNASICKFVLYSLQHSETFDVLQVFLPLTIAELSMLKQVRFFWPTLYIVVMHFVFIQLYVYCNAHGTLIHTSNTYISISYEYQLD